jgi:2-dehydropantoate 2-reductase
MFNRIAIVGSGAVGIYYGVRLAKTGLDVRFLLRGDLEAVRERGSLLIHETGHSTALSPVAAFGSTEEIGAVDLIVVALKTTVNSELEHLLPPMLRPHTAILTLQNGIGADEFIAKRFGAERVMGGLAFIAANRTGHGEVTCLHPGSVSLGEFGRPSADRTNELARLFERAGVTMRVVDNLMEARWRKLVWNIPFNGLAIAAGGISTSRLCSDPLLAAEVRALMVEIQRAAAAFGIEITDDFLRLQFEVTPPMGAYQPSSLVDFLADREVEIEAIWGEPLRRAQAAGVPMPKLELLHSLLSALAR